jgi:hypothetical protein
LTAIHHNKSEANYITKASYITKTSYLGKTLVISQENQQFALQLHVTHDATLQTEVLLYS